MKALLLLLLVGYCSVTAQIPPPAVQVKITDTPFHVSNAQQLNQIKWTMLGTTTKESIYCVSETPVSQLRFVCTDCAEKNITDMVNVLNSAQDLTRTAGYPTVALKNIAVNTNWTGATILCQAAVNGGTVDSQPSTIDVQYLRQPHVVDASDQGPMLIANQGYRFYVECVRGADEFCQQSGRRKTLKCLVQSHPQATSFRWLKNGLPTSGNGAEITIGTEMIGQSIQCQANNGLFSDGDMPTSQAVQIDPYSSARLIQENFAAIQSQPPFERGNFVKMNQQVSLGCQVEGHPRPVVFWKLRKPNGQVVDAQCAQGLDGQYQEVNSDNMRQLPANMIRLNAICSLRVANYSYSGQYWCSACSYVSQGSPECSPSLEAPGSSTLTIQVIGPPTQGDTPPTIEQAPNSHNAVVTVHYCAEPVTHLPRGVIFSVDQNDLQVGQSWENFRFESNTLNNTVPSCYMAKLQITPVREEDKDREIYLKLNNEHGSKTIKVSLDSLLGGDAASSAHLSVVWIIVIAIAFVMAMLVCCCVFCVSRKMLCFSGVKGSEEDSYTEPKAKANLNVSNNFYDTDSPRPYPPQEKFRSSYHEGVNYTEMQLSRLPQPPSVLSVSAPLSFSSRAPAPLTSSSTTTTIDGPQFAVSVRTESHNSSVQSVV